MSRTTDRADGADPKSLADRADRVLGFASAGLAYVSAALVGVAMVAVLGDVIGRAVFNNPVAGVVELGRYLVVTIALLGIPYAMRVDAHIRSTLFTTMVSGWVKRAIAVIGDIMGLFVFGLVAVHAWAPMLHALRSGQYDGQSVRFPTFPGRLIVFVAGLFMAVECIAAIRRHVAGHVGDELDLSAAVTGSDVPPGKLADEIIVSEHE